MIPLSHPIVNRNTLRIAQDAAKQIIQGNRTRADEKRLQRILGRAYGIK